MVAGVSSTDPFRRLRAVAVLIAVALVASGCTDTGREDRAAPGEAGAGATVGAELTVVDARASTGDPVEDVTVDTDGGGAVVTLDSFTVAVPAGGFAEDGLLTVTRRPVTKEQLPEGVSVAGDAYDVTAPDGQTLDAAAAVTFELDDTFDETTFPVIYWQYGADGLRAIPVAWQPGQKTVTATVDHFSFGFLGQVNIDDTARRWASNLSNYVTGRAGVDQPSCPGEDAARDNNVTVASDGGDSVKWCFGVEDGQRIVKVANNRRMYVEITYPSSWKLVNPGRLSVSTDTIVRAFTDGVVEAAGPATRDALVVSGGDTVTLALPDDTFGNIRVEASILSWSLSAIFFGVDVARFAAKIVSTTAGSVLDGFEQRAIEQVKNGEPGTWIDHAKTCFEPVMKAVGEDVLTPAIAKSTFAAVIGCVPDLVAADILASGYSSVFAGAVIAAIATVVGLVLTAVNLLVTGLRELWDTFASFSGDDDVYYDIGIGVDLPATFTPRSGERPTLTSGPSVMLVVDTSGSMSERDSRNLVKIEAARVSILDFLARLEDDAQLGLRTYPAATQSCSAGQTRFPLGPRDPAATSAIVRTLTPDGDTPTAEALVAAAEELEAAGATSGTIVLVSDGESTCEDPCEAAESIAAGGYSVQVHTVALAASPLASEELRLHRANDRRAVRRSRRLRRPAADSRRSIPANHRARPRPPRQRHRPNRRRKRCRVDHRDRHERLPAERPQRPHRDPLPRR